MIISASRRTDIPAFYSEWFFGRLKEGYAEVKNPFNSALKKVSMKPEDVDCLVFWTKNPKPMLERLEELKEYEYYFQFTLNSYGKDIEKNVPSKHGELIDTFKMLSEKAGKKRLVWRYDPILVTEKYTVEYHTEWFGKLSRKLKGAFDTCVISFIDSYAKTKKRFRENGIRELTEAEIFRIAEAFSAIAEENGFKINTCAESADLSRFGIGHSSCIDKKRIEALTGKSLDTKKDKYQRKECGCCESTDIGAYNTCIHNCIYCYANGGWKTVENNYYKHNGKSGILI